MRIGYFDMRGNLAECLEPLDLPVNTWRCAGVGISHQFPIKPQSLLVWSSTSVWTSVGLQLERRTMSSIT